MSISTLVLPEESICLSIYNLQFYFIIVKLINEKHSIEIAKYMHNLPALIITQSQVRGEMCNNFNFFTPLMFFAINIYLTYKY